jgi:hippurate hydrolase
MAAELVTELQTVASTRISPLQRGAIGVNAIHAGNKNGIIPEKATLLVTVRALESDTHDTLLSDTRYVAERIAEMHHAPSPPDIKVASSYVAGTQDPVFARQASDMLKPVLGEIGEFAPLMVGEDFYELARHFGIPALQVRVGGVPPRLMQPGATPPSQHSSTWAPEPEPMLRSGVLALTTLCLGLLGAPTS